MLFRIKDHGCGKLIFEPYLIVNVLSVSCQENLLSYQEVAEANGVQAMPTFMFFKDGKKVCVI